MADADPAAPTDATTIGDALVAVTQLVAEAGVGDTARLDAELLVGHVAGLDRVGLRVHDREPLTPEQWQQLDALVGRRTSGEPVAYLLGTAWFYGREFVVDERVLIPRPETELLVELALEHFAEHARSATFIDACTGSGCVAVTLAAELGERARVLATDLSSDALEVARTNAQRHGVTVELHEGDLLAPLRKLQGVGVIVANPPYVDLADAGGLEENVRAYEPHLALFPPDGGVRDLYEQLAVQSLGMLEPGGLLAVEHGIGQRELVIEAVRAAGFEQVAGVDDLAGIDRVVTARRNG